MSDGTRRRPVWTFAEADYRFGAGVLRMTVDHVDWGSPVQQDGEVWYEVAGVELSDDGRLIGPRRTMVRAARLSALRREAGGREAGGREAGGRETGRRDSAR